MEEKTMNTENVEMETSNNIQETWTEHTDASGPSKSFVGLLVCGVAAGAGAAVWAWKRHKKKKETESEEEIYVEDYDEEDLEEDTEEAQKK